VSPVKYELGSYIPEDAILQCVHRFCSQARAIRYIVISVVLSTTQLPVFSPLLSAGHITCPSHKAFTLCTCLPAVPAIHMSLFLIAKCIHDL
jgi:hypothetical protein